MKNKWEKVALKLKELKISPVPRPAKQCRERWVNKIDPSIEKSHWMEIDDLELTYFLIEKGKKWADIRRDMIKKRTEFSIRQRFQIIFKKFKKMFEKGKISIDETIIKKFEFKINSSWEEDEK